VKAVPALNKFNNVPDGVLVKLAQAGNQEALAALFLRYKGEIYICILNVVRNDEIAKDLWQDTYLKVWRHIQSLKESSRFKPWLLTIARHLAFDRLRRNRRENTFPLAEYEDTSDPVDWTTVLEVLVDTEWVRCILAKMEPVYRNALLLHAQGYSRAEIARQLGLKESTITTYLSLARAQFLRLHHKMQTDENQKGE